MPGSNIPGSDTRGANTPDAYIAGGSQRVRASLSAVSARLARYVPGRRNSGRRLRSDQHPEANPIPYRDVAIALHTNRQLAVAEFGDRHGIPVFWFHGTPGARLQIPPEAPELARQRGVRIISVDRPGTGGSSHTPRRTLLSWATDIEQCADALAIERFAAVGLSGGGPYVLACAHELRDRMVVGASLGGIGPTAGQERAPGYPALLSGTARALTIARRPLGTMVNTAAQLLRPWCSPLFDVYARYGARIDREVLERPDMRAAFTADLLIAMSGGLRGAVDDLALLSRPWQFSPRNMRLPIRLWHGEADPIVPLDHAKHLAALVPDSRLFVLTGLGHFAGFCNSARVFDDLLAVWSDRHSAR